MTRKEIRRRIAKLRKLMVKSRNPAKPVLYFLSNLGARPAFLDILVEESSPKLEAIVTTALVRLFGEQETDFALYRFQKFWYGFGEYGGHRICLLHFADSDFGLLISIKDDIAGGLRIDRRIGLDRPPGRPFTI